MDEKEKQKNVKEKQHPRNSTSTACGSQYFSVSGILGRKYGRGC
jgi:hypothetical protein